MENNDVNKNQNHVDDFDFNDFVDFSNVNDTKQNLQCNPQQNVRTTNKIDMDEFDNILNAMLNLNENDENYNYQINEMIEQIEQIDKNQNNNNNDFQLDALFSEDMFDEDMFNDILNNNLNKVTQQENFEPLTEQIVECNCCCIEFNIFDPKIRYISHTQNYSKESHYFCSKCVTSYFKTNMNSSNMFKCFSSGSPCYHVFSQNEFLSCVEINTRDEYEDILYKRDLFKQCLTTKNFMLCPKCQMSGSETTSTTEYNECSYCLYVWCPKCKLEMHAGKDCYIFDTLSGQQIQLIIEEIIHEFQHPKCPTCKVVLQKETGCNHMTCSQCKTESCYVCGKSYNYLSNGAFTKACNCAGNNVTYKNAITNNKKITQNKLSEIFNKNNYKVRTILNPIYKKYEFDVPFNLPNLNDCIDSIYDFFS